MLCEGRNREVAEEWGIRYGKRGYVNSYEYTPNPALNTLTFMGTRNNSNLFYTCSLIENREIILLHVTGQEQYWNKNCRKLR